MMALKKLCPRCNRVLIDQCVRYCPSCQPLAEAERKALGRGYDERYRNKNTKVFYSSSEWLAIRQAVLSRYGYLDIYDYYVRQKISKATTIHHIDELEDSWDRRLEIENLIPLTERNHNRIHALYISSKAATQVLLRSLAVRWLAEMKT